MRDCTRVERIVESWEEQGTLSAADLAAIEDHCATCVGCARRYAALRPLFRKDAADSRPFPAAEPSEVQPGFADRVMSRIGPAVPRRAFPAAAWAAAAAACLLLAAGIGFAALRLPAGRPADEVVVRFVLDAPGAKSVTLVGSFTGWSKTMLPMTDNNRDGVWQIDVRLKRDTLNTYNFVIDGTRWIADPRAPAQLDDGFGGRSSVLRL